MRLFSSDESSSYIHQSPYLLMTETEYFKGTQGWIKDFWKASATFCRKLHLSKMSPCPDLYPNPSGWWLKMWTYRLVFYGINLKILWRIFLKLQHFSTKHIFDEMLCIVLEGGLISTKGGSFLTVYLIFLYLPMKLKYFCPRRGFK